PMGAGIMAGGEGIATGSGDVESGAGRWVLCRSGFSRDAGNVVPGTRCAGDRCRSGFSRDAGNVVFGTRCAGDRG
ncbi:hypothetical protein P5705_00005, partial [Pseudomonas entomophila]|uniref:hypothetical protein n=1 Tax=Pseudomonas entomophila TaxID=312306 RepID=UPI002404C256